MAHAKLELLGTDLLLSIGPSATQQSRFAVFDVLGQLTKWARVYDEVIDIRAKLTPGQRANRLMEIGGAIFTWLDRDALATAWLRATGDRELQITAHITDDPAHVAALLDVPWEVLAGPDGHLVGGVKKFIVYRRIVDPLASSTPRQPDFRDIRMVFMAAAPEGASELDYEAEEDSIRKATMGPADLQLIVEETGSLEGLTHRIAESAPAEILHITCHGGLDDEAGPVLYLEDEVGAPRLATPADLRDALGDQLPFLVTVSACQTAAQAPSPRRQNGSLGVDSFARAMVDVVPHVLAWDGSVYDHDAISFAHRFYDWVVKHNPIALAAAHAREALYTAWREDPRQGEHWHLARIYVGPSGGGRLSSATKPSHPRLAQPETKAWLGKEGQGTPVASSAAFVGRRRQIQKVIRAFRYGERLGAAVLVHGMGMLGKSSLAARIADRFADLRAVVLYGRFDHLTLFDTVVEALPADQRQSARDIWRARLQADPALIADALEHLICTQLRDAPILLILDDLEQLLEPPRPGDGLVDVKPADRNVLSAVLTVFAKDHGRSRLLLTSRYLFRLPDRTGRDLAAGLTHVAIRPMGDLESQKQAQAAVRVRVNGGDLTLAQATAREPMILRAINLAQGNPGLLATLLAPILAGELAVAEKALDAVQHYRDHGAPPAEIQKLIDDNGMDAENAAFLLFRRLSLATYRAALTLDQARLLAVAALFPVELRVPEIAIFKAGRAAGVAAPEPALRRLLALGLVDPFEAIDKLAHVALNPLARPMATPTDPWDAKAIAAAGFAGLRDAWADAEGKFPIDDRSVIACGFALEFGIGGAELDAVAWAGLAHLFNNHHDARSARQFIRPVLVRLGSQASLRLLSKLFDVGQRLGDVDLMERALRDVEQARHEETFAAASILLKYSRAAQQRGDLEAAAEAAEQAAAVFRKRDHIRDAAIATRRGVAGADGG
jgi:hypothetical protein